MVPIGIRLTRELFPPLPIPFPDEEAVMSTLTRLMRSEDAKLAFTAIQKMYELLHVFDVAQDRQYERSWSQKKAHETMIAMMTFRMFRRSADYYRHEKEILTLLNRVSIPWMLLLKWTRRNGKTMTLLMFIAAQLVGGRGIQILFFTYKSTLIPALMLQIRIFLALICEDPKRVLWCNANKIVVLPNDVERPQGVSLQAERRGGRGESRNVLQMYPSDDTNGLTGDYIYGDEAGLMRPEFYPKNLAVQVGLAGNVIVLSSTLNPIDQARPGGTPFGNFCLRDPETGQLQDPGMELNEVVLVCEACKKADPDRLTACVHKEHLLPRWKKLSQARRVQIVMNNDLRYYKTDMQGLNVDEDMSNRAFSIEELNGIFRVPQIMLDDCWIERYVTPRAHLITYIDPAGGGPHSETAFVTLLCCPYPDPKGSIYHLFLVGLDSLNILNNKTATFITKMYFLLFQQSKFSKLRHYLAVESNYGGHIMASLFVDAAKEFQNIQYKEVCTRVEDDRAGFVLNKAIKETAYLECKSVFAQQRFHLFTELISAENLTNDRFAELIERMEEQLFGLEYESLQGKSRGPQSKDDVAISLMILCGYMKNLTIYDSQQGQLWRGNLDVKDMYQRIRSTISKEDTEMDYSLSLLEGINSNREKDTEKEQNKQKMLKTLETFQNSTMASRESRKRKAEITLYSNKVKR
jgi:hypothetical protein